MFVFEEDRYTESELAERVSKAIIELAAREADRTGMGWLDIREALSATFSRDIVVSTDGVSGLTFVRPKNIDDIM